jgi:hypothetical protein
MQLKAWAFLSDLLQELCRNALSFLVGGVLFVLILRSAGVPDASLLAWFALLILATRSAAGAERLRGEMADASQSQAPE